MLFNIGPHNAGHLFKKSQIELCESGRIVAVDIDLSDSFSVHIDRNNDLGLGLDGTREIARIGVDIVHDNGLARSDSRSADALSDGNTHMRRRFANERTEQQRLGIAGIEHVEAGPIVMRKVLSDGCDDSLLQRLQ